MALPRAGYPQLLWGNLHLAPNSRILFRTLVNFDLKSLRLGPSHERVACATAAARIPHEDPARN